MRRRHHEIDVAILVYLLRVYFNLKTFLYRFHCTASCGVVKKEPSALRVFLAGHPTPYAAGAERIRDNCNPFSFVRREKIPKLKLKVNLPIALYADSI